MPCCDMRRRVLSVTSTDVMWWSLMWCDQCPAECVLCHSGIQSLVHLGRNAVKEARLLMTSKTKQFCKWKCNQVIAAYGCTDSIWGLFFYFLRSSHEFCTRCLSLLLEPYHRVYMRVGLVPPGMLFFWQMQFLEGFLTASWWMPWHRFEGLLLLSLHVQSHHSCFY